MTVIPIVAGVLGTIPPKLEKRPGYLQIRGRIETVQELRQTDQRTRNLVTMHKALHPRDDMDYIC